MFLEGYRYNLTFRIHWSSTRPLLNLQAFPSQVACFQHKPLQNYCSYPRSISPISFVSCFTILFTWRICAEEIARLANYLNTSLFTCLCSPGNVVRDQGCYVSETRTFLRNVREQINSFNSNSNSMQALRWIPGQNLSTTCSPVQHHFPDISCMMRSFCGFRWFWKWDTTFRTWVESFCCNNLDHRQKVKVWTRWFWGRRSSLLNWKFEQPSSILGAQSPSTKTKQQFCHTMLCTQWDKRNCKM